MFQRSSPTELTETQAFRGDGKAVHLLSRIELVRSIQEAKGRDGKFLYPGVETDKLMYAVASIDQLNALGFTPKEVGALIMHCGAWDKRKAVYPEIQKIIDKKRNELKLSENDLENLVLADKIEHDIQRLRAMRIAQEELKNEYDSQMAFIASHPPPPLPK